MVDENNENNKNDIEVVSGDGTDIIISSVYDYVKIDDENENSNKKNIVIPKGQDEDKK